MKAKELINFIEPFPDAEVCIGEYCKYDIEKVTITIPDDGKAQILITEQLKKKTDTVQD